MNHLAKILSKASADRSFSPCRKKDSRLNCRNKEYMNNHYFSENERTKNFQYGCNGFVFLRRSSNRSRRIRLIINTFAIFYYFTFTYFIYLCFDLFVDVGFVVLFVVRLVRFVSLFLKYIF